MILIKNINFRLQDVAGAIFEEYLRKTIDFPYGIDQNVIKLICLIRKMSAAVENFAVSERC